jgi:ubiquinol-cytochrome c reductase iron-sulfur subunit
MSERPDRDHPGPVSGSEESDHRLRVLHETVPAPSETNDMIVVGSALVAAVGGLGFGFGLLLGAPLSAYGSALAIGLLAMGLAVRRYFVDRFPDVDAMEPREFAAAPEGTVIADVAAIPRRGFLGRVLAGAAAAMGLGLIAPVVSLGPAPGEQLRSTAWSAGRRVVRTDGRPLRPGDLAVGGVLTAWPEGAISIESAAVIVLRLTGGPPEAPTNLDWVVEGGVVAYSKVCTHAGCPVGLFRERDDALFCPCHQSTFDARRGAVPTFGPAARPLPQLPMDVDDEGFLVATADFADQVGPAFG